MSDSDEPEHKYRALRMCASAGDTDVESSDSDSSATSFESCKARKPKSPSSKPKTKAPRVKVPDYLKIPALAGGLKANLAGVYPERKNNYLLILRREYPNNEERELNFDYLPDVEHDPSKGKPTLPPLPVLGPYCECGTPAKVKTPFRENDREPDEHFGEHCKLVLLPSFK